MKSHVGDIENKSILLVDVDPHSCEARAQAFRDRGVMVDCAQDAAIARTRYQAGIYDLVLVDLGPDIAGAQQLVAAVRQQNPKQKIAFLLGVPPYVSQVPGARGALRRDRTAPPAPAETAPAMSEFGRRIKQIESQNP